MLSRAILGLATTLLTACIANAPDDSGHNFETTDESREPMPRSDGGTCEPPVPPNPDGAPCTEQADCYFDACTKSQCIDFVCRHELYPDGQFCFGTIPPVDHFAGVCECGACTEAPPPF